MGFGASFYGFFVAAALWMCLYFVLVLIADRRDQRRSRRD
jgi:hypothetical protein